MIASGQSRPSGDGRGSRSRWVTTAIVALALFVILVTILAVTLFLGVGFGIGFGVSHEVAPERLEIVAAPDGAPAADFFSSLRPGDGSGPEVDGRLRRFDNSVEAGTGVHVATAHTAAGVVDIFEWQTQDPFIDGQPSTAGPADCVGYFYERGSSVGCSGGVALGVAPEPGVGTGSNRSTNSAQLEAAPAEAAWFVIETDQLATVTANVIARSSYAAWPAHAGVATRARILDADFNELWSMDLRVRR